LEANLHKPKVPYRIFQIKDTGKVTFSKLAGYGDPEELPHEERTRQIGRVAGTKLRDEYNVTSVRLINLSIPYQHYLQRNPALVAGIFHGLLDEDVQVYIDTRALKHNVESGQKPKYYEHFLRPLRERSGCFLLISPKDWKTNQALLEMVPHEERLFYISEYNRLTHEHLALVEKRKRELQDMPLEERIARATQKQKVRYPTNEELYADILGRFDVLTEEERKDKRALQSPDVPALPDSSTRNIRGGQ